MRVVLSSTSYPNLWNFLYWCFTDSSGISRKTFEAENQIIEDCELTFAEMQRAENAIAATTEEERIAILSCGKCDDGEEIIDGEPCEQNIAYNTIVARIPDLEITEKVINYFY